MPAFLGYGLFISVVIPGVVEKPPLAYYPLIHSPIEYQEPKFPVTWGFSFFIKSRES